MTGERKSSKRPRVNFTEEQIKGMDAVFTQTQYPDVTVLEVLADKLQLPMEKICTWFQNRRSKFRRESKKGHINWMRKQLYDTTEVCNNLREASLSPPIYQHSPPANSDQSSVLTQSSASPENKSPTAKIHHFPETPIDLPMTSSSTTFADDIINTHSQYNYGYYNSPNYNTSNTMPSWTCQSPCMTTPFQHTASSTPSSYVDNHNANIQSWNNSNSVSAYSGNTDMRAHTYDNTHTTQYSSGYVNYYNQQSAALYYPYNMNYVHLNRKQSDHDQQTVCKAENTMFKYNENNSTSSVYTMQQQNMPSFDLSIL